MNFINSFDTEEELQLGRITPIIEDHLNRTGEINLDYTNLLSNHLVFRLIDNYGERVTKFLWRYDVNFHGEIFLMILNKMPNLVYLKLNINQYQGSTKSVSLQNQLKPSEREEFQLNLKKLKSLDVTSDNKEIFRFIANYFVKNSLTELSIHFCLNCSYRDPSTVAIRKEYFNEILKNQKFIKKLKLKNVGPVVDGKLLLNIEELSLDIGIYDNLIPNVKQLQKLTIFNSLITKRIFSSVAELSKLESLNFKFCTFSRKVNWNELEALENLKNFEIKIDKRRYLFLKKFRKVKLFSLESLKIFAKFRTDDASDFYQDIKINFPNLKEIKVQSLSQKINFYAKYLRGVEKLSLTFDEKISKFYEFDTGIENENLKELNLTFVGFFPQEFFESLCEIVEPFPELETLELNFDSSNSYELDKIFIGKIQKLEKLKVLKLKKVVVDNCLELTNDLRTLARNIENILIELSIIYEKEFREELKDLYEIEKKSENCYVLTNRGVSV